MSFWDVVWFIVITFAFVACLVVFFSIIGDLFRDKETSGFVKAVWIVALIFLPLLGSLVYLIARGSGMAERTFSGAEAARQQQDAHIREAARTTPAEGRAMLDSGALTQVEYDNLSSMWR